MGLHLGQDDLDGRRRAAHRRTLATGRRFHAFDRRGTRPRCSTGQITSASDRRFLRRQNNSSSSPAPNYCGKCRPKFGCPRLPSAESTARIYGKFSPPAWGASPSPAQSPAPTSRPRRRGDCGRCSGQARGAKAEGRNSKHEIRSTKYETNQKYESQMSETWDVTAFLTFVLWICFGFLLRIS